LRCLSAPDAGPLGVGSGRVGKGSCRPIADTRMGPLSRGLADVTNSDRAQREPFQPIFPPVSL
jgi:hypothetical protein